MKRAGPMEGAGRSPAWALFVGPYGIYLLVFLVLPFANVALLSVYLHSPTKIAVAEFTGANYAKLWEVYYFTLFLRTLRLSLAVTVLCAVLGLPLAPWGCEGKSGPSLRNIPRP